MVEYSGVVGVVKRLDFLEISLDNVRVINYPLSELYLYPKVLVLGVSDVFGYCEEFVSANSSKDLLDVNFVSEFGFVRCRFIDLGISLLVLPSLLSLDEARNFINDIDFFESLNRFLKSKLKRKNIKIKYTLQGVFYSTPSKIGFKKISFRKVEFWRRVVPLRPTGKIKRFLVWGH